MRYRTPYLPLLASLFTLGTVACGAHPATGVSAAASAATGAVADANASPAAAAPSVGSVAGYSLAPQSTASAQVTADGNSLVLVVSSQQDYCGSVTAGKTHPNHVSLVFQLVSFNQDGNDVAVGPGTYTLAGDIEATPGAQAGIAVFNVSDAECKTVVGGDAELSSAGTVTLTAVGTGSVAGTYAVTFGNGNVKGTFSAPACAALLAQVDGARTLTCAP